jgi:preprotein translocase subunit SecE
MTEQTETGASALDTVKLAVAAAILVGGVAAFYWLVDLPVWVRWLIVFAALGVGAFVALQSAQGRTFWQFVQGSRVELRKVVWPTREETIQTTIAVLVFALIGGTFFWLLDVLLLWLTSKITGQGV